MGTTTEAARLDVEGLERQVREATPGRTQATCYVFQRAVAEQSGPFTELDTVLIAHAHIGEQHSRLRPSTTGYYLYRVRVTGLFRGGPKGHLDLVINNLTPSNGNWEAAPDSIEIVIQNREREGYRLVETKEVLVRWPLPPKL